MNAAISDQFLKIILSCLIPGGCHGFVCDTTQRHFSEIHNFWEVKVKKKSSELQYITNKFADVEDCSRRNNVKIRGIPISIQGTELIAYLQQFFKTLVPELSPHNPIIDCIHRLYKCKHIPAAMPHNILMCIFFQANEHIILTTRNVTPFSEPYSQLTIFADISGVAAQKCKEFTPSPRFCEITTYCTIFKSLLQKLQPCRDSFMQWLYQSHWCFHWFYYPIIAPCFGR